MKRLPIIRHIRYYWHLFRVTKYYAPWDIAGLHPHFTDYDRIQLDRIWRGEA